MEMVSEQDYFFGLRRMDSSDYCKPPQKAARGSWLPRFHDKAVEGWGTRTFLVI